ncbi:MAG: DNA polymerase III subunit alpha [Rickettsiaceae bacterium]|nr:DNA polymerase III subunit alpha [Rickettsiaceae bacterium]
MDNKFIHFRVQSSYSMLESALRIDKIVSLTKDRGMPAVCLADRGNLFGSLEFSIEAAKKHVQPIHGSILNIKYKSNRQDAFAEILLIAKDEQGFENLLELVSRTFTVNDRSNCNHITYEDLEKYHHGLIVGSAYTEGIIGRLLESNDIISAKKYANDFKELFGDRFYFEITRHGYVKEASIEKSYLEIARALQIPLLATNNVLFEDITKHDAHDVLLCISNGVVQEEQNRPRVSNQSYFKSEQEMVELFKDLPEAIANTTHLAKRCYVRAQTRNPTFPKFAPDNESEEDLLRNNAKEGLNNRLKQKEVYHELSDAQRQKYYDRLNYELDVICKMQFAGYFLIVADFINWSKQNDIAVGPGRGSGAGSIIAWALGITGLDPIEFGLLFERFLNPERVSLPDFDIDFCQEKREDVISYVRSKYGDDRVAQIITFGKMQAKAVIKDVSRVLGLRYAFADYLTELVPFNAVNPVTLGQAIEEIAELNDAYKGKGLYNLPGEKKLIKQVLDTSLVLEGLHRHASTHAAGLVISNERLIKTVPVYKDINSEMLVIQYSMKYAELAGLVKFDFLGLQTLTLIKKTAELINKSGQYIDIDSIVFDDQKTFKILSQGLSTGIFQFESVGMKNALRKLQPDKLDDIIALGALYRPGPMDNIPTYIACKHNEKAVDYLHPVLTEILQPTYGVIIYQEQVMEIARKLSGYTLGAADLLRRAMGKKVKSEMDAQREKFVSGAIQNNVSLEQANSIFDTVAKFAGYGFNKSHASAYGVLSYQTAYLKANYPLEFFVACLNLEIDNSDKINVFLQDAKNFDIVITPPDINISNAFFKLHRGDSNSIIFALAAIKNVSISFGEEVERVRTKYGPYKSIIDFIKKIPTKLINRRLLENIIKAGCFDSLHSNRNMLLASLPKILAYSQSYHLEKKSNQFSLIALDSSYMEDILQDAVVLHESELATLEFEALSLYLKNHPLSHIQKQLFDINIYNSSYLKKHLVDGNSRIKLFGIITKKDSRMSPRGRFINLLLSDPDGNYEVTIFNEDVLKTYAHLIDVKMPVIIYAEVSKDKGGIRITANKFAAIEEEISNIVQELKITAQNDEALHHILSIISKTPSNHILEANIKLSWVFENDLLIKIAIPGPIKLSSTDFVLLEKQYSAQHTD